MTALVANHDWEATPLGPISKWPPHLRGVVDALLSNPAPGALLLGPSGLLIYNQGYAAICGNKHPAALGRTLEETWPEVWEFNRAVLAAGLAGRHQVFKGACFALERDGVLRDSWFDLFYGPVPDARGKIVGVLATVIEITDRVEAEQLYREQQTELDLVRKRLEAMSRASFDLTYRMSPDWSQMRQLEGRGFLRDTSDPSQVWVDDYIPEDERTRVHEAIARAIRDKAVFCLEHRVKRLDGSEGWTLSRAVPMLDGDGEISEWVGAASDISVRKANEERLKQADQRKDEFLAMLAHELRNPLAPVRTAADLLQTGRLQAPDVQRTSAVIGRQVSHMTGLIDDLLDVSRVTRGLVQIEIEPLQVTDLVLDAVEQVTPLIQARNHRLRLELAPEEMPISGDRKRLVQVLSNLLNNAAKYTPPGGEIAVRTGVSYGWANIEVRDNGIGMSAELGERAFDLFVQGERTPDRATGGLGLGLPLVKSLVQLHGGTVHCVSEGVGKGSCFTVCLPCRRACASEPSAPARAALPDKPLHILIVDDNADAAEMMGELLQLSGHRTSVELGAHAALERGRRELPEAYLIDIGLPEMDGYAVARALRAHPATADALLVALTGYGQDNDRAQALAAGFDAHLIKPVEIAPLMDALARGRLNSRSAA